MRYILMRKNDPITLIEISEAGQLEKYSKQMINEELAPLQNKNASNWLCQWWRERSIPIKQGKVEKMLQEKGILTPERYLAQNLGLSLNDYYWTKPLDSDLQWKDVNLYENNFRDNALSFQKAIDEEQQYAYTPNSSLQGQLEKSWVISNDKRILIKGNRDQFSTESINEVIASEIHKLQDYPNYTSYNLIQIKNKDYDYGCYSECFTNLELEAISAYGVLTSEKQPNDSSSYEHFINLCGKHGMDTEILRSDLEYQIMTDFILSNRDRHLNNISILRDANTLEFKRMAPIYDTGKSFCVNETIPYDEKELLNLKTNSFAKTELKLLSYIHDRQLVDISKLPDKKYIMNMHRMDSQMNEKHIKLIGELYDRKIDKLRDFQLGKDLNQIKIPIRQQSKQNTIPSLDELIADAQREIANKKPRKNQNRERDDDFER